MCGDGVVAERRVTVNDLGCSNCGASSGGVGAPEAMHLRASSQRTELGGRSSRPVSFRETFAQTSACEGMSTGRLAQNNLIARTMRLHTTRRLGM